MTITLYRLGPDVVATAHRIPHGGEVIAQAPDWDAAYRYLPPLKRAAQRVASAFSRFDARTSGIRR